jgi:hypothetical protein
MNCVKITILINEKKYIIYHGFPGDNASGILLSSDEKYILA